MKKNSFNVFVILLSCLVALFSISSCKKESEKMAVTTDTAADLKTTFSLIANSEIGYLNENNQFVGVTEVQLLDFIKGLEFVSENGTLSNYGVVQGTDDAGHIQYALLLKARDGDAYVNSRLNVSKIGDLQFAITNEGCSCKSTNCADDGCNASKIGDCSCSDCGAKGTCEKTSSRFDEARVRSLFN